jgi:hypothetical protein
MSLQDVDMIIRVAAKTQATKATKATKQLSPASILMLLNIYSYREKHNFLPKDIDLLANNKVTLLDKADTWLAEVRGPTPK